MTLKRILKRMVIRILPTRTYKIIQSNLGSKKIIAQLNQAKRYDIDRILKHTMPTKKDDINQLIGLIIREYHVIEKGLTMPEPRLGFGKEILMDLIKNCLIFTSKYAHKEEQLMHAISVVIEYELFHEKNNYILDNEIVLMIEKLKFSFSDIEISNQKEVTQTNYFSNIDSPFPEFSWSRSSVRNYSNENVDINSIIAALDIARSTPSACNRQPWRTYVFDSKNQILSILNLQGGNRGFGHLSNKLIIICSEISMYAPIEERNGAYVDGGMYAMNLLYALHYKKIAACILNCSFSIEKDKKMRKLSGIKESEVFIAMITCGIAPESFKITNSYRYNLMKTNTFVQEK